MTSEIKAFTWVGGWDFLVFGDDFFSALFLPSEVL